jgi:FolB domain-containing protein
MDKIIIKDALFLGSIGITKKERSKKQEILIDLEICLDLTKAGETDDLSNTLDYVTIVNQIQLMIDDHSYNLIEALAAKIIKGLMLFDIISAIVKVKKPSAIPNVGYTSVSLFKEK